MTLTDFVHACHSSFAIDAAQRRRMERTMRTAWPAFTKRGRRDPTMDKHTSL